MKNVVTKHWTQQLISTIQFASFISVYSAFKFFTKFNVIGIKHSSMRCQIKYYCKKNIQKNFCLLYFLCYPEFENATCDNWEKV